MTEFGALLKKHRLSLKKSLREFCLESKIDPGNHSKLERGRLLPPKDDDSLAPLAKSLGLEKGSEEWTELFDAAAVGRGNIPSDLLDDDEVVAMLPAMFRTVRGQKIDSSKLDEFVDLIRKS